MNHADALAHLAKETKRARRRLRLERAMRAYAPLALALVGWASLAMAGVVEAIPDLQQSLLTIVALGLFVLLFVRARKSYRAPSEAEARAQLAVDNGVEPASFDALADQPVRYDAGANALWRRAQDTAARALIGVKAKGAGVNRIDPYRVRYGALALLVASAVFGGAASVQRLHYAFTFDPGPLLGDKPAAIEAWATPADYTRAAPISLSERVGDAIAAPPQMDVFVRLTGPTGAPRLVLDGDPDQSVRFTRAADGAWEAHMPIDRSGALRIVRFRTRAQWRINASVDEAPKARFTSPIAATTDGRVAFAWSARDDYGLENVSLRVAPVGAPNSPLGGLSFAAPIDTPLASGSRASLDRSDRVELDLMRSPYAGMDVEARIVGVDARGQEGVSQPMRVRLPSPGFSSQIARAALEVRASILAERTPYREVRPPRRIWRPAGDILTGQQRIEMRDPEAYPPLDRAPRGVQRAVELIDILTQEPEDGYYQDLAVFLGLRLARAGLTNARSLEETEGPAEILWLTAQRAEFGGAADARSALDAAARALSDALESGADSEEVQERAEALRESVDRYLDALVQEALREDRPHVAEERREQTNVTQESLQEDIEDIERLSAQERRDQAQDKLDQLQEMLNNLQADLADGPEPQQDQQNAEQSEAEQEQAQQQLEQLNEAMQQQEQLNDQTQQAQQQQQEQQAQQQSQQGGGGGQEGSSGGGALAEQQAEVREQLSQAQEDSEGEGGAPAQNMSAAERAMRRAEEALARGDFEGARAAQSEALNEMRRGADALAQAAQQGDGDDNAQAASQGPADPLGRSAPIGGAGSNADATSSQANPARTRALIDEIRRRAQDPSRSEAEREYLGRLLDRFGED